MAIHRVVILGVLILLGGCSQDRDSGSRQELLVESLPGVYTGVFPCADCPGIPTTLWLRSDSRFFIEQKYPAVDKLPAMNTQSLGRWNWLVDERTVLLKGSGPMRRFVRPDADTLIMQTDSDLEHRLVRELASSQFSASISMVGMMRMRDGNAWFRECLTGLEVPVSKGGDFSRLRHQFRSARGEGGAVAVELEGRFSWAQDGAPESLKIERLVTVKSEGVC